MTLQEIKKVASPACREFQVKRLDFFGSLARGEGTSGSDDVSNSCDHPFSVRVTFTIYDKDELDLSSDSEEVYVPAMGTDKARGKMLVSPPDKAQRMARQGASL